MREERVTFTAVVRSDGNTRFILGDGPEDWLDLPEPGRYRLTTTYNPDTLTAKRLPDSYALPEEDSQSPAQPSS